MKQLVLIICLLAGVGKTIAQCDIDVYKELIAAGDQFVVQKKYKEALNKYNAARLFCENKTKETDVYIARLYDQINQEKINAENNYRKAHLFSQYIDFKNNRSAWIYSDGFFAVIDSNGNLKSSFVFENPQPFKNNIAIAILNNKYVFVNDNGHVLSEKYDYIIPVCCGNYYAHVNTEDFSHGNIPLNFILNEKGQKIAMFSGDDFENKDYKISNIMGDVFPPSNPNSGDLSESYSLRGSGFIDSNGHLKFRPDFKKIYYSAPYYYYKTYTNQDFLNARTDGPIFDMQRGDRGILDKNGNVLLPDSMFEFITEAEDGYCLVKTDHSIGSYQLNGVFKKLNYDFYYSLNNSNKYDDRLMISPFVVAKTEKRKYRVITKVFPVKDEKPVGQKKPKTKVTRDNIAAIENEKWIEYDKNIYRLINTKGELLGPDIWYDSIEYIVPTNPKAKAILMVQKDSVWGLVDLGGRPITTLIYSQFFNPYNNSIAFNQNGAWGLMDFQGQIMVKPRYESLQFMGSFYYGIKNKDTNLISLNGDIIPNYVNKFKISGILKIENAPDITYFKTNTDMYGILQKDKILINPEYDNFKILGEGFALLYKQSIGTVFTPQGNPLNLRPYSSFEFFHNGLCKVMDGNKMGYLKKIDNHTLKEIIPPIYNELTEPKFGLIIAKFQDTLEGNSESQIQSGCLDTNGKIVLSFTNSKIPKITENYLLIEQNNQINSCNHKGDKMELYQTPDVNFTTSDYRLVYDARGWQYLRKDGSEVCKTHFTSGYQMNNGYALIFRDSINCIVDSAGNENCNPSFGSIIFSSQINNTFSQGKIIQNQIDNGPGYLSTNGSYWAIDSFNQLNNFSENMALIKDEVRDKAAILNIDGTLTQLDYNFIFADNFHNGFARVLFQKVSVGGLPDEFWGFVNQQGKKLHETYFQDANNFSEGLAAVKQHNKWYYINTSGKIAFNGGFEFASSFKNNIAFVRYPGNKYGTFINKNGVPVFTQNRIVNIDFGQELILEASLYNPDDEYVSSDLPLSGGIPLLKVQNDSDLWGLMNLQGEMVIPCRYDKIWAEKTDVWLLEKDGRFGLYDIKRNIKILNPVYNEFGREENPQKLIRVKKNGYWGWIDYKGNAVIPFRYLVAMPFENGRAWVKQPPFEAYFQINLKGEMLLNSIESWR